MSSVAASEGSFSVRIDRARSLVTMEIMGVWDHGTVDRWEAALVDFLPGERHRNDDLRMLVDVRYRMIHAREVAARVQARIAWVAPHFTRIAVVLSDSALLALQSRRLALGAEVMDRQRFFAPSNMAEAHAWLEEGLAGECDRA